MKYIKTSVLIVTMLASMVLVQCKPDEQTPEEQPLALAIDPDTGTTIAKSLSSTYNFKLIISSTMPSQGVEVNVDFRKDADNSVVFSQTLQTSSSNTDLTISNLVFNEPGTVTIAAKSKTKATNTATKTFKLVRK